MNTSSKDKILSGDNPRLATAEQRLKQLGIKLPTPPEPFGIYAERCRRATCSFHRNASHYRPRSEIHRAHRRGNSTCKRDVRPLIWQRSTPSLFARQHLGSTRQSYPDRPARRVGGHGGDIRNSQKSLTALQSCCRTSSAKQKPLPPGVWRCKPSARHPGRVGIIFEVAQ